MSLQPYQRPYCEIFYHGSVSATGDPAPLVPADMRGPGITEVVADTQLDLPTLDMGPRRQPSPPRCGNHTLHAHLVNDGDEVPTDALASARAGC